MEPLIEVSRRSKAKKIFFKNSLEVTFKDLKWMFSVETLLNHPDYIIPFIVHIYASDK